LVIVVVMFIIALIGGSWLAARFLSGQTNLYRSSEIKINNGGDGNYGNIYGAAQGGTPTPAALFTATPAPTMTPTETPNVLINDAKYGWGYTHDVQCVRNTFEKMGVQRVINIGQAIGNDGSPSATLGLIGVISDGNATSEFDNLNGRSLTVRGGESGQITTTQPLHIVFVYLSQNDIAFANYYSKPSQDIVVTPTGEELGSVGFEINQGKGTLNANLLYSGQTVGILNGPIKIAEGIGSVYNVNDPSYQMLGSFGNYAVDNLRGLGVPVEYLAGGCWAIEMSISVPEQAVMTIGFGSFQKRYSAVADYSVSAR